MDSIETITFKASNDMVGYDAQLEDASQKHAIKYMDCKRIAYRGSHPISEEELGAPNRQFRRAAQAKDRKKASR